MSVADTAKSSLLQALLHEYRNAIRLYTNTIAVTYTRIYGLLATHGGLFAAFFVSAIPFRIVIAILGIVFALSSWLAIEHVWLFTAFRIRQALDIEIEINNLLDGSGPTTFQRQFKLFTQKNNISFTNLPTEERQMPKKAMDDWLIKKMPFQADKLMIYIFVGMWPLLTIIAIWFPTILG